MASESVTVTVFWSKSCAHCHDALGYINKLEKEYSWIKLEKFEISVSNNNAKLYDEMAQRLGQKGQFVPGIFICDQMIIGFSGGEDIRQAALNCFKGQENKKATSIEIPFFGKVETSKLSLPVLTIILAGMDAFNPCAFFVLLFLLSLMVHARSKGRMLLVGGVFIFFSGLIYFLFMAAWLNLFMVIGHIKWVTTVAGVIALTVASLNIKDFFWFKKGISLSISDKAKPELFKRMRNLISSDSLGMVLLSTVTLAIVANSYELLCTAGFPMVYTRALTLKDISVSDYYLYLLAYNIIYVIPLMVIVLIFTFTLGGRKLSEKEGQFLKLLSGCLMLSMGIILLINPSMLTGLTGAFTLVGVAALLTLVFSFVKKRVF